MNFGNIILNLRKQKNLTQEELAAELGVTAAAVSKWENNYTLPDLLMLCALADFFNVTTDELLGRCREWKPAIIAAETKALGLKMAELAKAHGLLAQGIYTDFQMAEEAARQDSIQYLIAGFHNGWYGSSAVECTLVSVHPTEEGILDSLRLVLQNHVVLRKHMR